MVILVNFSNPFKRKIVEHPLFYTTNEVKIHNGALNEDYVIKPLDSDSSVRSLIRYNELKEAIPYTDTQVVSAQYTTQGEYPDARFWLFLFYHDRSSRLTVASRYGISLLLGSGMTITSKDKEATDLCNAFAIKTHLFDKIANVAKMSYITGLGLFKLVKKNGHLVNIEDFDSTQIIRAFRDEYGNVERYEYIVNGGITKTIDDVKEYVPLVLLPKQRSAFGYSFFHSLALPRVTRGRESAPLVEHMWAIEDAIATIVENNANPIMFIQFKGLDKEAIDAQKEKFRALKPGDKVITKEIPEIKIVESDGQSKYEAYIKMIEKTYMLGTGFPYEILQGDFTSRASSSTTDSLLMRDILAMRARISNVVQQDIFYKLLLSSGVAKWDTPEKVMALDLQISFNTQVPIRFTPEQVAHRVNTKMWTVKEGRDFDKANGQNLSEDKKIEDERSNQEELKGLRRENYALKTSKITVKETVKPDDRLENILVKMVEGVSDINE